MGLLHCCLLVCLFWNGNADPKTADYWHKKGAERINRKLENEERPYTQRPRNVILFIAPGMSFELLTLKRRTKTSIDKNLNHPSVIEQFSDSGIVRTSSLDYHTSDKFAAVTATVTGRKVYSGTMGIDPMSPELNVRNGTDGPLRYGCVTNKPGNVINDGVLEKAIGANMNVGIVFSGGSSNSTLASSFAKGINKNFEGKGCEKDVHKSINDQFFDYPASNFSMIAGYFDEDVAILNERWMSLSGKRKVLNEETAADLNDRDTHYFVNLNYDKKVEPIIDHFTQNLQDYILVIEVGDFSSSVKDIEAAVQYAKDSVNETETLLLVVGDVAPSYMLPAYADSDKPLLTSSFNESGVLVPGVLTATGPDTKTPPKPILKQDTIRDSAADIPIFAHGPYSWLFSGSMENTDIAYTIKYVLCFDRTGSECVVKVPLSQAAAPASLDATSDATTASQDATQDSESSIHAFARKYTEMIGKDAVIVTFYISVVLFILLILSSGFYLYLIYGNKKKSAE